MYYNFTVGDDTYKLKLTTRDLIDLEKILGFNAILLFGLDAENPRIPTTTELVTVVTQSFKSLNHGIKNEDVYDIIDKWLDEGHITMELANVVLEVYTCSGIISKSKETKAKNQ